MILAIDIGNTNIKFGLFDGERLACGGRLTTSLSRTSDEYGMFFRAMLNSHGVDFADVAGVIISSVIPAINYTIIHMCRYYTGKEPLILSADVRCGLKILYNDPTELGSDRMASAAAAYKFYGGAVLVVDFGTATTFNLVNDNGEFLGGAIAPGVRMSMDALTGGTARLKQVELSAGCKVVGKSTADNLRSGIVHGFAGMTESMVAKIKAEANCPHAKVIATGGISELIRSATGVIDIVDRELTLKGLNYIYRLST